MTNSTAPWACLLAFQFRAQPTPRLASQILARIVLKSLLAARCAEVVHLAFILALELGRLLIDGHLADRIYCHFSQTPMFLFCIAGGIYFLSRSEKEITVTELKAMARPASSGRKVMPNAG